MANKVKKEATEDKAASEEFDILIKATITPTADGDVVRAAAAAAAHIAARVDDYPINTNGCDVTFKTV